jgi:GT2 family glycosyltransferase
VYFCEKFKQMMQYTKVSLIIPTYKREELLVNTIKCALDQTYQDYEIIVVDQTKVHTKETQTFLAEIKTKIVYIQEEKASLTHARNVGVQRAKGDIFIFTDDDVVFERDFIENYVCAHQKADVIQGRVIHLNTPMDKEISRVTWNIKFPGGENLLHEAFTNIFIGCSFSLKRKVYEKVGDFDENFIGCAVREDSDYSLRCYKAGFPILFYPDAMLTHLASTAGGVDADNSTQHFNYSYYLCEMRFASKHFPWIIQKYYAFRLYLRGFRAIKRLVSKAIKDASKI